MSFRSHASKRRTHSRTCASPRPISAYDESIGTSPVSLGTDRLQCLQRSCGSRHPGPFDHNACEPCDARHTIVKIDASYGMIAS